MKFIYRPFWGAVFVLLTLAACTENDVPTPEPEVGKEDMYIRWDVIPEGMQDGRALIEENMDLQAACTPGTGGKAIGIWSAYELDGEITRNVLGNPDGDVSLVYKEQTEDDNYEGWTYGEKAERWTSGAKYTFNAYFPKSVVREISSSDVSTFVAEYNTEQYQEDLMVACAYVDTQSSKFKSNSPVPLNMLHTLAAIQFRFMFMNSDGSTYRDEDKLTACSLENTVSGRGIATTGILTFDTVYEGVMDTENIHWYGEDYPEPTTPGQVVRRIYNWEDASGIAFSSEEGTGKDSDYTFATSHSSGNQAYSSNNGWILTIPQQLDGTTLLCFKLASTGELIHHIHLPATTLKPGTRYVYSIRFGQTETDVKLTIADWNELKSSYDISL